MTEEKFIDKIISELPQYGIETSDWEHDYGDCCYGGAIEFLSRCIEGYSRKVFLKKTLDDLFEQVKHGDEGHVKWLRDKFDDYIKENE